MPTVFRFRYQRILDVKQKQQKALEIELGRVDRLTLQQQALLRSWERTRQGTLDEMRQARTQGDLADNAQCAAYVRHVRSRMEQCRAALADLRVKRERVRQDLQRAMQSRQVIEKYRDRLRAQFLAELEKAEEAVAEVHTLRKFSRAEGML